MLRPVMQQNLTSLMIVTLGFGYVFQGGASRLFGGDPRALRQPVAVGRDPLRRDLVHLAGRSDPGRHAAAVRRAVAGAEPHAARRGRALGRRGSQAGRSSSASMPPSSMSACSSSNAPPWRWAPAWWRRAARSSTSMGFDEVILTFVVVVLGGIGSVTGSLVAGLRPRPVHRPVRRIGLLGLHDGRGVLRAARRPGAAARADWRHDDPPPPRHPARPAAGRARRISCRRSRAAARSPTPPAPPSPSWR